MRIAVEQERSQQGGTAEAAVAEPAPGGAAPEAASAAPAGADRGLRQSAARGRRPISLPRFHIDPNEDTAPQAAIGAVQVRSAGWPASAQPWASLQPAISTERPAPAGRPASAQPTDVRPHTHARHGATGPAHPASDEIVSPLPLAGRRPRLSTMLIVVLALIAAGSLAVALHRPSAPAPVNSAATGPSAAAKAGNLAAGWIVAQISQQTTVGCDPAMCGELVARGIHPDRLLVLQSAASDPLAAGVVVETLAVRRLFGTSQLAQDAPVSLASFGTGGGLVSVDLVAQHGAASLDAMLAADLQARKASAATLLSSSRITVSPIARGQLAAGLVDSRLLVVLARLAAQHPIDIIAFGDSGPHASAGIPLRSAELAQSPSDPIVSTGFARSVRMFVEAQRAPYRPAELSLVPVSRRQTVLVVEFPAPSPLLLLSPRRG